MREPMPSTTSVSAQTSKPSAQVRPRWCSLDTTPRPERSDTTGACRCSARARTSAEASWAPLPTMMSGRRAPARRSASRSTAPASIGAGRLARRVRARVLGHGGADGQDVPRRLQRDGPRPARGGAAQPLGHEPGRLRGVLDALRPLRERPQRPELVGQLVQVPEADPDVRGRHLAREAEDRLARAVRGAQAGRRVQDARARDHAVDARPAGGPRVAQRHVGRRLLVARRDDADRVARAAERVEQLVGLDAGDAEDGVDAFAHQRADDRVAGADLRVAHRREATRRRARLAARPPRGPAGAACGRSPRRRRAGRSRG